MSGTMDVLDGTVRLALGRVRNAQVLVFNMKISPWVCKRLPFPLMLMLKKEKPALRCRSS